MPIRQLELDLIQAVVLAEGGLLLVSGLMISLPSIPHT
jgi:hypothetical protein